MPPSLVSTGAFDPQALLAAIVDSSDDAIIGKSLDGTLLTWNRAAERLYGYAAAEVVGHSIALLIPPDRPDELPALLARLAAGEHIERFETERLHKDGSTIPVTVMLSPIYNDAGAVVGASSSARDSSTQRRAERERAALAAAAVAQAAAEAAELRFRSLLEATPDAMVIADRVGRIALLNGEAERLFGYSRAELLGQHVEVLLPERFRTVHEGHRAAYGHAPSVRQMGAGLELYGRRRDGSEVPVEVSLSPVEVGGELLVISAIRDIRGRKQADAALHLQTNLIELAHDAILVRDSTNLVLEWNAGAAELYGWPRAEALGQVTHTLLQTRVPVSLAVLDAALEQEGQWAGELVHTCRDGRQVVVESRQSLIRDDAGRTAAILEVNRDITARRQAETALHQAVTDAERANLAKSDFLSRMSHELRTPLNAVLGFGQLLALDPLAPQQQKGVAHILKAGHHLLDLINEVLDIARIESGRLSLSPEPVRLREVVDEALDLVRTLAVEQHIGLNDAALVSACGEQVVLADRQRLTQVLLNLLSNAIKYNRSDGTVTLRCETGAERVRLGVQDTGGGIAADKLGRVFEPFDRLGAETTEIEGTGLGLALSKGLMQAMAGTLGVESTLGVGSTFWVDVPLAQHPLATHAAAEASDWQQLPEPTARGQRTILYVEDNLPNLELIEQLLARWSDVALLPAMLGQLGVELAVQHQPDLILLDVHLPDLSGHEVLQLLQEEPRTRDIPVVVVSADATETQIQRLLAAGARAYLTKPFEVRRLLALIGELLASRSG